MRKVKVGDIIRVSKGRKAAHVTNIKIENALRYIQIEDLRSDNILQYSLDKNGVFVDESDICIAWDGANAGTVGYGLSGIIGSTIARLRLEDKSIYTPYVGRFLQTKFHILNGKTTGTTIPHVERSRLDNLELSLPSFGEQRRIAAILDKADAIRRKRQEALKLADGLVKSRFIEMFGDPMTNPMGWGKVNLCDAAGIISGITKGRKISKKQTFPIPYMRVANVKDGYIDLSEIKMIEATSDEATYYRLLKNDILMTEGGDPDKLGRGAIWFGQIENCIHQNHIFRVRLNNAQIHPVYFAEYLKQSVVKKYFLSCAKQTTGIASINMTQLKALPTIVPPLSLQTQFAAFVEQVDKLKFAMQRQLAEAETSKASLMQQFFS